MSNPILKVSGLTVHYHDAPVLWDIGFELPRGTFVGILGPNGAGKSTLIKAILELIPAVSGSIWVDKKPVGDMRKKIAYVPQREAVDWDFPITVKQLVLMGCYPRLGFLAPISKKDHQKALECLEKVGIIDYADRQISQLSGGQQQRAFLARALMQDADIYFLDEPLAGVDHTTEEIVIGLLRDLVKENKTVLMVHHDLNRVEDYFSWVLMLNMRLIAIGPTATTFTRPIVEKTYAKNFSLMDETAKLSHNLSAGMS
ncbi:MAG: ABC transporter ATP-binding protein [Verrucomicrobia bacterium]|nr:ABC transporter ATP-binding protein [Verrucomicrobiota bacterium]MBS0638043.1 ABC transporter ATP-binding protein [Verrucomicrobiota bacterium]